MGSTEEVAREFARSRWLNGEAVRIVADDDGMAVPERWDGLLKVWVRCSHRSISMALIAAAPSPSEENLRRVGLPSKSVA